MHGICIKILFCTFVLKSRTLKLRRTLCGPRLNKDVSELTVLTFITSRDGPSHDSVNYITLKPTVTTHLT